MYQYNPDMIQASIAARKRIRKACRAIIIQYSPAPLPESVIRRICTRRKLWNFLNAIDLSESVIQSIFWSYRLSVPRNRELKPAAIPEPETKPNWLSGGALENKSENINEGYIF